METTDRKELTWKEKIEKLSGELRSGEMHLSHSSFSGATDSFWQSPRAFVRYKFREVVQTEAMKAGVVKHCAVLEPDEFDNRYAWFDGAMPKSNNEKIFVEEMLSNGGDIDAAWLASYSVSKMTDAQVKKSIEAANRLEAYMEWLPTVGEREIISASLREEATWIREFLWMNRASKFVLKQVTETEKSVEWQHGEHEPGKPFNWKGYVDGVGDGVVCDLKFMGGDCSPRKVRQSIVYGPNARQAAHYTLGAGLKGDYYIIACDQAGNDVTVMQVDQGDINRAWDQINEKLMEFVDCLMWNNWADSYDAWTRSGIYSSNEIGVLT